MSGGTARLCGSRAIGSVPETLMQPPVADDTADGNYDSGHRRSVDRADDPFDDDEHKQVLRSEVSGMNEPPRSADSR
jgi:hypothetical protein